jgi:DNA-binding MarR family transcriptional regulator
VKRLKASGSRSKSRTPAAAAAAAATDGDGEARAVLDSIRLIVQTLRISSRAAERDVGVSAAQLFVLTKLAAAARPLSVGELAEHTLTHQSSVSVVVQKLERQGLVARTRAKDDARRVELSLTSSARTLLRKAPQAAQDIILNAVAAMPAARRRQLADLLADLAHRMGGERRPVMLFEDEQPGRR